MNILQYGKQFRDFASPFVDFVLLSKPFNYTVKLSPQDCIKRLLTFEQPKTGFWSPSSKTVQVIHEVNQSYFEICTERYGRGLIYNSAKASGMITSVDDDTDTTTIKGNLRLGKIFLLFYVGFLLSLVIFESTSWVRDFGFILLVFAVNFLYIARDYRDYHRLDSLIRDTFSDASEITNG